MGHGNLSLKVCYIRLLTYIRSGTKLITIIVEEVKKLRFSCCKHTKGERVLFHYYNGHGVPKPTGKHKN
ncbi:hypothetical protein MKX03_022623 [Papaver bracteatum]|nr:hypothetical protein MKX03_022623 [Papaver bracteatum]